MPGVSNIYSSPIALMPIDKTAVKCFVPKHKESAFKKRKKKPAAVKVVKKKVLKPVPRGGVSYKKAGGYHFIPSGVVVLGVPVRLAVPGWSEAFSAIINQLRLTLNDDLKWIDRQYTREDVAGDFDPRQSCLTCFPTLGKMCLGTRLRSAFRSRIRSPLKCVDAFSAVTTLLANFSRSPSPHPIRRGGYTHNLQIVGWGICDIIGA